MVQQWAECSALQRVLRRAHQTALLLEMSVHLTAVQMVELRDNPRVPQKAVQMVLQWVTLAPLMAHQTELQMAHLSVSLMALLTEQKKVHSKDLRMALTRAHQMERPMAVQMAHRWVA